MKYSQHKYILLLCMILGFSAKVYSQEIIEHYAPKSSDSLRIGTTDQDFFPLIQKGYTLSLPESTTPNGVIIVLEDSGFDKKNKSAKQLYSLAGSNGLAVLSVSTEIPFDFYFSNNSALSSHKLIKQVFEQYDLPNKNVFFIGVGLSGHRAMKHIEYMKEDSYPFQLNIKGIVLCNAILDWASEWYKFDRELRNKRNDLWEPTFVNYMLEKNLNGTPKNNIESYFDFSTYSYFDEKNDNIKFYTEYAVRAYIEPAIKYWLEKRGKTMYDNNSPDMVGLLAELDLAGNENTELIVLQPEDNPSQKKNPDSTWEAIDKEELMRWINSQLE